jgi:hypothetical protein
MYAGTYGCGRQHFLKTISIDSLLISTPLTVSKKVEQTPDFYFVFA